MTTVVSSPTTWSGTQSLTFAIPSGTYVSGSWNITSSVSGTSGAYGDLFTTASVHQANYSGSGNTAFDYSLPLTAAQITDVNNAAGGNLTVSFTWEPNGAGSQSVTACTLVLNTGNTEIAEQGYNQVSDVNNNLVAGTITNTASTSTSLSFTATNCSGGTTPYSYQWSYRLHGTGSYVNFGTNSLSAVLTGLSPNTAYDIQLTYTDAEPTSVSAYDLNVTTDGVPSTSCSGTQEAGVCKSLNIPGGTGVTITGPWVNRERASWGMIVHAQATGPFNLDYLMSPDGGNTWYLGQQVAATVVTVDGDGETSYTYEAEIAFTVGFRFRIDLYNTGASEINGVYEWRYTSTGLRGFGGG